MHWCTHVLEISVRYVVCTGVRTYVCVLVYVHRMCVSAYCGRHALVYVHTYVCVLEFTVVSMHWRVCVCVCVRVQCVEESQDLAENSNLLFFSSFEFTHILIGFYHSITLMRRVLAYLLLSRSLILLIRSVYNNVCNRTQ